MELKRLVSGMIGANTYILIDRDTAAVIDPSAPTDEIMRTVRSEGARITAILLTHGHFDHMLSLEKLRAENPETQVMIHVNDAELMPDGRKNAFYTFFGRDRDFGTPDKFLSDQDVIPLGSEEIRVMHTPGHTGGSVCYRIGNSIFSGDTIMADGYGRCDLYSGDAKSMLSSLERLKKLSEKEPTLTVYPGHGNPTALANAINNIF